MKISTLFFICITTCSFSQNISLPQYKTYFDKDLKSWSKSFENFKLENFKISDSLKFEQVSFGDTENLKQFYSLYEPVLSFSPDSSKFIDIYSYWLNLEKKENKIFSNFEVDQAVSFFDSKNSQCTRILFCGYSTRIDEVVWIDNTYFILAGTFLDDNNLFHPQIFLGNIIEKTFNVYRDSSIVMAKVDYKSSKLNKINIHYE